ncbi:hypothetical protein HMPREF0043_00176 [Actinobaculum sp. oral taxon 183 str. F0552]|nr:hypothetical protein HMPREF0043_00176 [Actinobaculum sp. oral taxon 183 str. F0552]
MQNRRLKHSHYCKLIIWIKIYEKVTKIDLIVVFLLKVKILIIKYCS